jgi:hypothetical protein
LLSNQLSLKDSSKKHQLSKLVERRQDNIKLEHNLRYDSVMNDKFLDENSAIQDTRMFVTFNSAQAYPEYIITYRRNLDKDSTGAGAWLEIACGFFKEKSKIS